MHENRNTVLCIRVIGLNWMQFVRDLYVVSRFIGYSTKFGPHSDKAIRLFNADLRQISFLIFAPFAEYRFLRRIKLIITA